MQKWLYKRQMQLTLCDWYDHHAFVKPAKNVMVARDKAIKVTE